MVPCRTRSPLHLENLSWSFDPVPRESGRGHNWNLFRKLLGVGVLHHLNDAEARVLVDLARDQLPPGGRLVTLDPALVAGQHLVARALAKRDRGDFVRSPDGYRALATTRFESVQITEHHDYLRLPFAHFAM